MEVKKIIMETHNEYYHSMMDIVTSYIDWKQKQKRVIRGGKVMYDVKGYYKFLYQHDLYNYWYKNVLHK